MERETKSFETPGGRTIVVKSYLTGRESDAIKNVLLSQIKMSMEDMAGGTPSIDQIPASFITDQENKTVEMMLVSIDGTSENVFDAYQDLPENECAFISDEIKKIRTPLA